MRTIRRLPPEEQQDQGLLAALQGAPWSPKGTAEVESTLPELALEQFRFAAGKGGPLKGEEETTENQEQQGDDTTGQGGATSSSSSKRPNTEGQQQPQMRRRMTGKTTDLLNEIPPPPGLPAPSRKSMEVEPTEATAGC